MTQLPLKIIVAEDHEIQRTLMCMLIEKLGYEALPAENGEDALRLVQSTDAQILISDLHMPSLNGIELTREVRRLDLDRYVHIVMVTGRDDEEDRRTALLAGVDDFMSKSPDTAMLTARIRAATRLIRHETELAEQNRILKEAKERIEDDLRAAALAQRCLLPELKDEIAGFRVSSAFEPSSIVSGDMFDCFALSEDELGFYAVDVSGHGVRASLLSVAIGHLITPAYFRNQSRTSDGNFDLSAMVSALNARFFKYESDEYFTMFCGVLNKVTGQLDYCQAGHPSPFYIDAKKTAKPIGDGGYPVGILPNASFENGQMHIEANGAFVMCSDAAIEATDKNLTPFGVSRLTQTIEQASRETGVKMPDFIVTALDKWREGAPLEDDLTVVSIERNNS